MNRQNRSWIYLVIGLVVLIVFGIYRYGFQDRYYNLLSTTTSIDLAIKNKVYLIEKHPNQGNITQLELQIKGKLSDNITIYLSKDGVTPITSIRIKKGKIETAFIAAWHDDKAYLIIENPYNSTSRLDLEYQFIANN